MRVASTDSTPAIGANLNPDVDPDLSAAELIDIDEQWHDDLAVLRVSGEVDILSAPLLGDRLAALFITSPRVLVLDLAGVTYLGSSGLAVLVQARDSASHGNVALRLVLATQGVRQPLAATALLELFDTYETQQAARH